MRRILPVLGLCLLSALPARAEDFAPVRDKTEFMSLMEGRELRMGMFRIALAVLPDGKIKGSALGWDVEGSWRWQDGYFCRAMDWSGEPIPYNCQLVEVRGKDEMRFTVDKGAGKSASFSLR